MFTTLPMQRLLAFTCINKNLNSLYKMTLLADDMAGQVGGSLGPFSDVG